MGVLTEATGWGPVDRLRTVTIRPVRDDDEERLARFFGRLSRETLYRRFFTAMPRIAPSMLDRLVHVDHHGREALVAIVHDEIVAEARYDRSSADPAAAEAAVVVEDGWQRLGIGAALLERLGKRAWDEGIDHFDATALSTNQGPVRLAQAIAPIVQVRLDGSETQMIIPLHKRPKRASARVPSSTLRITA